MFIKTVIIDGFKSYGKRTEIQGFDPEFTAITGLNGTGKSNVLDAICFVLGISNLGQVRATSLQELVYKGGQCGVTKATVTLIFDNSDPKQHPLGYDKCDEITVARQVIVGGKNKYMINGKIVLNKKVSDLFCSVQLNINNPNFLIMQGRITKVLNMKAIEILSMIEEAAGTSMYESKRDDTAKLIEKKDTKIKEISEVLIEEILPKLNKLREEREQYMEFQKIVREIEYLTRIYVSHKYLQSKKSMESCEESILKETNFIDTSQLKMIENDNTSLQLDQECKAIQQQIDNESGGELRDLELDLTEKSKEEATAAGAKKAAESGLQLELRNRKALEKSIKDDEKVLAEKQQNMAKVGDLFESLKQADEVDSKAYADAKKRYEAISSGLATNEDGEAASLQDQLITAKKQISESVTTVKQSEMELKHATNQLNAKTGELKSNDAAYLRDKKSFDAIEAEIKKLEANLSQINYQDGTLEQLDIRRNELQQQRRELRSQVDRKGGHRFEFQYRDPEPNFNKNRVKGMVCMLFDIRDGQRNAMALGMSAGGMLHNIVTDTDVTSKLLIQKGQLQSRSTMIPINKISDKIIPQNVVAFAQNLVGADNVSSALSLIEYSPDVDKVMRYVFGRTLVCTDIEVAKKVTYHPNIMCRTVTLDGDIVDPEGTLSGGSRPKGSIFLLDVAEIRKLTKEIANIDIQLHDVTNKIEQIQRSAHAFNQIKEKLDLQRHELENIKHRLTQSSFQQQQNEIEELQQKIKILKENIVKASETKQVASRKVTDIESKLVDAKGYRERELKSALDVMKAMKTKSEQSQTNWKRREQEYETHRMEIEELKTGIDAALQQANKLDEKINNLKDQLNCLADSTKGTSAIVATLKAKIKEQKEKINSQNKELKAKYIRKEKMAKQNQELVLEIKKSENTIAKLRTENKDGFQYLDNLEKKYKWIAEDKKFFGTKNTRYDYSKEDPVEAGKKLHTATTQKNKMERNINVKAMMMLEREEKQYEEVSRRKQIIQDDKDKIKSIIEDLDEKKKLEVKKAWEGVSLNFGRIFSTLLPGAQAKLVAAVGDDFLSGLAIKVGFNDLWKESLNELSGGQRSLVALSLILAMLKFKPAPLYILDEVDAALDMSHTQNIGNMLKTHFKNSQFIIVSLKDGMFNNANVLFKTKFVDGVSAITRTVSSRLAK